MPSLHKQEDKNQQTSVLTSIGIGAVAGAAEIGLNHPLWVIKTRQQNGYPFRLNPFILYKGILAHATSEVFLCILQVSCAIQTQEAINNRNKTSDGHIPKSVSLFSAVTGGAIGGGLSALVTNPTELVMTVQQKRIKQQGRGSAVSQHNFFELASELQKKYGMSRLLLGLPCTGIREIFYTAAYFAGTSAGSEYLLKYLPSVWLSAMLSGASMGLLAAFLTHPFDTIKTVQHGEADATTGCAALQACKKIYSTRGAMGFFDGLAARAGRVASATAVIGTVVEAMRAGLA